MNAIVHDVEQRSPEWVALRLGRVCGCRAADMLAGGKGIMRRNLRVQLALERVTGRSQEKNFISGAMRDGMEREDAGVLAYEVATGRVVRRVGYVSHPTLMAGCSPDGVIREFEGLTEFKCPTPAVHWEYLESDSVPSEYAKQIVHGLWITGAQWCDFVSYCPEYPEALQLRIIRIERDEPAVQAYEAEVKRFLLEVDAQVAAIRKREREAA